MQKPIVYLVQGQAELVSSYTHLAQRKNADLICLTYDQPLADAIFFPGSTWAEGRNHLLEAARSQGDYLYYVFCDDDIEFSRGSWDLFEEELMRLRPAIGVPVVPKTTNTPLENYNHQAFLINDEQLMAFHRDVINDNLVLPYQTQFDDVHWWISCELQEALIQNFYRNHAIQFNRIEILNTCSIRYDDSIEKRRRIAKVASSWLTQQFRRKYKTCRRSLKKRRHKALVQITTWLFNWRLSWNRPASYHCTAGKIHRELKTDSALYKQHASQFSTQPT